MKILKRISFLMAATLAFACAAFPADDDPDQKAKGSIVIQYIPEESEESSAVKQEPEPQPAEKNALPGARQEAIPGIPLSELYPYIYLNYGQQYPRPSNYEGSLYKLGYAEGHDTGLMDRVQGNLYNPRQYERSGDPDYFEGFVAGYRDGFRR